LRLTARKENSWNKDTDKLSRKSFTFGEKEDLSYGRGTNGKSQADKEENHIFLMSLLPFIKKLGHIQRLEHRLEFLSSVKSRIQISKKFSQPFNNVLIKYNSLCLSSPSPSAASID